METQVRAFLTRLQTQKRYTENTLLGYENDLKHFIKYIEASQETPAEITDLTSERVIVFLEAEYQNGKMPSTIRRRLAAIKRFHQFLCETGYQITLRVPKNTSPLQADIQSNNSGFCLNDVEIETLMQTVQADARPQARRDLAILATLLETGLSVSKLVALNVSDFEITKNRLLLTETANQPQYISLDEASKILRAYLLEGRPELNPDNREQALFISQMGMRVSRQGVWQICQRWGKRAKLSDTLSPRRLRHTAVQRMWKAGRSQKEIRAMLNHRSRVATQSLLSRIQKQTQN